jgi:uncharacterized Zn finger protein
VAAVYYLLGEEFDRDPFLLFRLRGLEREELLGRLGAAAPQAEAAPEAAEEAVPEPEEPLSADPTAFWSGGELPADLFGEVQVPPASAALLRRLGNFPFWRGRERLPDVLTPVYRQAAQAGLGAYLGERAQ